MYANGFKKVLSSHPGQVDCPSGQVTFHSHWTRDQANHLTTKSIKEQTCPGRAKF